jgi:hypothetical protein
MVSQFAIAKVLKSDNSKQKTSVFFGELGGKLIAKLAGEKNYEN